MSRVTHHGFGVWCSNCKEVHENTEGCDHWLDDKDGIRPVHGEDYYIAQPADMGHYDPHQWIDVDGYDVCASCGATKIPAEKVDDE